MRILVACEFSGIVREAFAKRGHRSVSVDLLPSEIQPTENSAHYQEDIIKFVHNNSFFDLMIGFPPCTYLAVSGARWFKQRHEEQESALKFVRDLMNAPIPRICIENPVSIISTRIRKPDQIIHPWMFGHGETKTTCLWLKNLPKLKPTNIVKDRVQRIWKEPPSPERWKNRSRTYPGVAEAMAEQWGNIEKQSLDAYLSG